MILKGQHINIWQEVSENQYIVLAESSTSCTVSVTGNTADAASKSDTDPMYNNPEFTYYDWSVSNESFICSLNSLHNLLSTALNGDCLVRVAFNLASKNKNAYKGPALITGITIDAVNGEKAKLSLSLEGCGELEAVGSQETFNKESSTTKLEGKAFMLAMYSGSAWHTFLMSKSHKLTFSAQTADNRTKDDNENAVSKTVTGKSLTFSTENLVNDNVTSAYVGSVFSGAISGQKFKLGLSYLAASVGKSATAGDWTPSAKTLFLQVDALITSFSLNAPNKEFSTYSAEFTACGSPTLTTVSASSDASDVAAPSGPTA